MRLPGKDVAGSGTPAASATDPGIPEDERHDDREGDGHEETKPTPLRFELHERRRHERSSGRGDADDDSNPPGIQPL
jgi:hypothetical protein